MGRERGFDMDRPTVKPPFAYYGGKTTLAEQIAGLLPEHDHYVEPFAGSLAVLLAKSPSRQETVNDLDRDLVSFWRVLRDRPLDLEMATQFTPHSRDEFETSKHLEDVDDLERARRTWVRLTQSRQHSMKSSGWKFIKSPSSRTFSLRPYWTRIEAAAERMAEVSLECRDALDVIRDYGSEPSVCMYVDPPYLGSTRASGYRHELLGADQHSELAEVLNTCRCSVVLSGYDSPLYTELFGDWHATRIQGATTLSGENDRVEVLWSNRLLGEPDLFGGVA